MNSKICLLLATKLEAKPILSRGVWRKKPLSMGVVLYEGKEMDLAIIGIGPTRSALSMGVISGLAYSAWLNIGVAGALKEGLKVGDVLGIGACYSRGERHPFDRKFDELAICDSGAKILTVGEALHDSDLKMKYSKSYDLVDMEAYSIAYAAKIAGVELKILKSISDDASSESEGDVVAQIPKCMVNLWKFIEKHNYLG